MSQKVFTVEGGFGDEKIEYRSGVGIPGAGGLAAEIVAILASMPKGSFWTNISTGQTYKKIGAGSAAVDFTRHLVQADYDSLVELVNNGGDTTAGLAQVLENVKAAVGLGADGTLGTALQGTELISAETSLVDALKVLDAAAKQTQDDLVAEAGRAALAEAKALADAKTYVDQKIGDLVDNAPDLLNTLNELAAALQNNPDILTTLQTTMADGLAAAHQEVLDEKNRAEGVESTLDGKITAEKERAEGIEAGLRTDVDAAAGAVVTEKERAEAAEEVLTDAIAQEVQDRTEAVNAEKQRAETKEGQLAAAITLLDKKQTETGALLMSARKESNSVNVSATTVVDEVASRQVEAAKWVVYAKGTGADVQKRVVVEVLAMHNGTESNDADAVDFTSYAKLKLGALPADLKFDVQLAGTGGDQRMQLTVTSPTMPVDVYAVRERIPGIDLAIPGGGGDGNSWTPGDPNFYFGSESYTPDPNIVF